jgi:hypothetical protein
MGHSPGKFEPEQPRPSTPSLLLTPMYAANAPATSIASYNIKASQFEHQQRVRTFIRSFLAASTPLHYSPSTPSIALGLDHSPLLTSSVNSRPCLFGIITKHETDATQAAISAHLVLFANFRDFCSLMTQNYEFLTECEHNIPKLTRIDNFLDSIQA